MKTIIEIFIMLVGYSSKLSQKQCKLQLSKDNLGEQRSWRAHFQAFKEHKIQNFGNHGATSGDILGLLQTFRFQLPGGCNVCSTT